MDSIIPRLSNLWELVAATASDNPDAIAVVDGDASHTYGQLARKVELCTAWLHDNGLRCGDRLGVWLRKGVEEIIATFAAARLGAVFVNIHPQWTLAQLHHAVVHSGARLLIVEPSRLRELQALTDLPTLVVLGEGELPDGVLRWPALDRDATDSGLDLPPPSPDALGALLYTSGSTGRAKGVMHSQRNLVDCAASVAHYLGATSDERVLGLLPISFGYGLNQMLMTFYVGGTLVLQRTAFPVEIAKTLHAQRITGVGAVPLICKKLITYLDEQPMEFPALRYVTSSGGTMSERDARRLQRHLRQAQLVLMYGNTETLRSTYLPAELFAQKAGAIGKAIPNLEVFCIDSDGRIAAPGEIGELVHAGAHVSQGYWNDPEATRRSFRSAPALRDRLGDAIVHFSGDLVRVDDDGVFWFVSRADWMVKCGGFRFSTHEVEELIVRSGLVDEVAVFAVDDDVMEQVVHAVVAVEDTATFDLEALERFCWKSMPNYMAPRRFYLWQGALPTTANSKLDRMHLWRSVTNADGLPVTAATLTSPALTLTAPTMTLTSPTSNEPKDRSHARNIA